MPRNPRNSRGGYCYHVFNRGNFGRTVFRKDNDYSLFESLLTEAEEWVPARPLAYCLMPNHFHLVLWPRNDGELSDYMRWLMTAHVRRHHSLHRSSGHLWEGRFKAFPIQKDDHLLMIFRYIEANPIRAKLVRRAEKWRWSSAGETRDGAPILVPGPVERPRRWLQTVNTPQDKAELEQICECPENRLGRTMFSAGRLRHGGDDNQTRQRPV